MSNWGDHPERSRVAGERAMVKSARRVVAVCDSTKSGRRSLSRIVSPAAIHQVIRDKNVPQQIVEARQSQNI
jgi:DeoR family transcriptional regulator of aga operon